MKEVEPSNSGHLAPFSLLQALRVFPGSRDRGLERRVASMVATGGRMAQFLPGVPKPNGQGAPLQRARRGARLHPAPRRCPRSCRESRGGAAAGSFWKPLHQHCCGLRPPPPGRAYTLSARWGYAGRGPRRRGWGGAAEQPPPPWAPGVALLPPKVPGARCGRLAPKPGARSPAAFSLPDSRAGAGVREVEPGAERASASGAEAGR